MTETTVKFAGHHHPLQIGRSYNHPCCECGYWSKEKSDYYCTTCCMVWHRGCMAATSEINHPCHPHHALKLLTDGAPNYTDGKCHFCRETLEEIVYHCPTCNFTVDIRCALSPKQVTIDESKCHNHPLTLLAREVSFVCNVCGAHDERSPYVCISCSFMVHERCIGRPHVININRHEHRISHTNSLGFGNRKCKICRLNIDWMYGAYSCKRCPDFVVHSRCATNYEVWDGDDLQGIPEEEEDEPLFKEVKENVIRHRMHHPSHDHLSLIADGVVRGEGVRCQLCDRSVYSDKFYSCVELECDYVLHQTCAYLPMRKRLAFSNIRSPMERNVDGLYYTCYACNQLSSGYMMSTGELDENLDLRCAAADWSCDHESHPHAIFLTTLNYDICGACESPGTYVMRCVECKFNLDYKCATYPKKIMHRCDDHPLVLSFGDEEQQGTYWCTVCETRGDPKKWFYECQECGIVCHIQCVFGDFANVKPRLVTVKRGITHGVVRNNGVTRPHCSFCSTLCLVPFVYRISQEHFCSIACAEKSLKILEELDTSESESLSPYSSDSSDLSGSDKEWKSARIKYLRDKAESKAKVALWVSSERG